MYGKALAIGMYTAIQVEQAVVIHYRIAQLSAAQHTN